MESKENKQTLYKDEEGKLSVNTLFADELVKRKWYEREKDTILP